ncbi:MAG: membrane protein insertase YidC [Ferruginibacter sp.]
MDRNTVIGFVLIGILLMGMFYINSKSRLAYEGEQKRIADSVARLHPPKDTTISRPVNTTAFDTSTLRQDLDTTGFQTIGKDAALSLSNNLFTVYFKSKGGQPGKVVLKNYKKYDGTPVVLNSSDFNNFSYVINAGDNKTLNTANVYFEPEMVPSTTTGDQVIRLSAHDKTGRKITHQYTLHPDNYMIDLDVKLEGADKLFSGNNALLEWKTEASQVEKDHKYELTQTHIAYVEKDKFDFETVGKDDDINLNSSTQWVALKQQFFIAALQAENKFNGAEVKWTAPGDTTGYISRMTVAAKTSISGSNTQIPLKFYFGPSDYNVLKKYGNQMENIVPYGSGIFSFVKYINRYFLLPVFDFLRRHVASMGIVILLLTLLIRLITSPILYKSYLSGAKMKVLKPEVDALKAKHTDPKTNQMDQQAFSMDQMKLWRTAGVSPLGGCLPALLQIPIFMSLYYFFQSNIDLRGKSFLWASDLASYDSIFKLPIDIPFYGDHVSLFTLTAVITSLLISIYSMSQMQDNNNPLMKYMPYIFPILLLGVFNRLPSALTWYYTISNLITLILQVVIQKYIIDHEKILAQIAENRKRVPKKSKWQERLDSMQDSQKKLQDMKQKPSKK